MSLPPHRRIANGRTFGSVWDPASAGYAAWLPPRSRRGRDIGIGLLGAAAVIAVLALLRWAFTIN